MWRSNRSDGAFTLPEVLVSMVILGVVVTIATVQFTQVFGQFSKTNNMLDSERKARTIMAKIGHYVRQASPNIKTLPGNQPVTFPTIATINIPADHVDFTEPSDGVNFVDANPANLSYDQVTIKRGATVPPGHTYPAVLLVRTKPDGTVLTYTLGNDAKTLTFTARSKAIYDIDLTIAPTRRADQQNDTYQEYSLHTTLYVSYFKE